MCSVCVCVSLCLCVCVCRLDCMSVPKVNQRWMKCMLIINTQNVSFNKLVLFQASLFLWFLLITRAPSFPLPCSPRLSNSLLLSFSLPFLFHCCLPLLSLHPLLSFRPLGFIPPPFSHGTSRRTRFRRGEEGCSLKSSLCVCILSETPAGRKKLLFIPLRIPTRPERSLKRG